MSSQGGPFDEKEILGQVFWELSLWKEPGGGSLFDEERDVETDAIGLYLYR